MCTSIRPDISEKNKYWISKNRYYELKHFCLQYPTWKRICLVLDDISIPTPILDRMPSGNKVSDPTAKKALVKIHYEEQIKLIDDTAKETDPDLMSYIVDGVTKGASYEWLKMNRNMPCCRATYYDRYRKFFWLLDKARG